MSMAEDIEPQPYASEDCFKTGWRTKDGELINIDDMSIGHIKNCIRMLKRNNCSIPKKMLERIKNEQKCIYR